jgi:hypothetical protein
MRLSSSSLEITRARTFCSLRSAKLFTAWFPFTNESVCLSQGQHRGPLLIRGYRDIKPSVSVCINATIAFSSTSLNPRWPN